MSDYSIKAIDVKQNNVIQVKAANDGVIPTHPFRMYVVGASGSGKTNLILNLLTRDLFYKDYFQSIIVISPTARNLDASYQHLNIPEENFFNCNEEVLETIKEIQEERKHTDMETRTLVLLDDIVSFSRFCRSDILLQFAVMSRHWNVSMIILSQAYHRIPKSIRLQMSCVAFFKGSNKELDIIAEDLGAPGLSKKQFISLINKATRERYNFFFVDLNLPLEKRYRKNLTEVFKV